MRTMALLLLLIAAGCSPEIGDSCESSVDCSVNGERICDRAHPGGYCTVQGCEMDTCPDEAVCVEFRAAVERLASSWCMATCEENDDCRDGYECRRADEMLELGETEDGSPCCKPIAGVLDEAGDGSRFCAVPGNPSCTELPEC